MGVLYLYLTSFQYYFFSFHQLEEAIHPLTLALLFFSANMMMVLRTLIMAQRSIVGKVTYVDYTYYQISPSISCCTKLVKLLDAGINIIIYIFYFILVLIGHKTRIRTRRKKPEKWIVTQTYMNNQNI